MWWSNLAAFLTRFSSCFSGFRLEDAKEKNKYLLFLPFCLETHKFFVFSSLLQEACGESETSRMMRRQTHAEFIEAMIFTKHETSRREIKLCFPNYEKWIRHERRAWLATRTFFLSFEIRLTWDAIKAIISRAPHMSQRYHSTLTLRNLKRRNRLWLSSLSHEFVKRMASPPRSAIKEQLSAILLKAFLSFYSQTTLNLIFMLRFKRLRREEVLSSPFS